jgi:hypothetical protein
MLLRSVMVDCRKREEKVRLEQGNEETSQNKALSRLPNQAARKKTCKAKSPYHM